MSINKEEFEALHKKVDEVREDVSFIKGLLKERNDSWTIFGIIGAYVFSIINWLK